MTKKKVLIIVGPTASGKSDLAVKVAQRFNGEVISADSRQVYKGLDVGTGKITKKEMGGVPHHLLDIADPKKQFSASTYKRFGEKALNNIIKKNKLPVIVGGTGFYIDTLTSTVSLPEVEPNPLLRKMLEKMSADELFKLLANKDPDRAKDIDQHNKVRIIRALEIIEVLGLVPKTAHTNSPYSLVYVGLKPDGLDLEKKIYQRLIKRLPGMIREAKKLHSEGLSYARMQELGLEYRYLALYLQEKLNKDEMVEKLNIEIRKYAKRQMTWFKRNKDIKWFKPEEYRSVEKYIKEKLD
jgi:tRNA dimethylallyltransferase